ncbi:hypothetical protein EI555_008783 [Monodon monoceros]|uniref:Uncharacterized protein n=1 Tax=Monodon monoceros TaxID=40151 RepID=A0A4U1FBV3_MONMO|nr:hypothetical protein EI555_008783 [Monodon monoceros]
MRVPRGLGSERRCELCLLSRRQCGVWDAELGVSADRNLVSSGLAGVLASRQHGAVSTLTGAGFPEVAGDAGRKSKWKSCLVSQEDSKNTGWVAAAADPTTTMTISVINLPIIAPMLAITLALTTHTIYINHIRPSHLFHPLIWISFRFKILIGALQAVRSNVSSYSLLSPTDKWIIYTFNSNYYTRTSMTNFLLTPTLNLIISVLAEIQWSPTRFNRSRVKTCVWLQRVLHNAYVPGVYTAQVIIKTHLTIYFL